MGYRSTQALAKVFTRVPTYDELAREEYITPQKLAPGIKREYTRFIQSNFYIRAHEEGVQKTTFLDEVGALQHLGGGLQPLSGGGGTGSRRHLVD